MHLKFIQPQKKNNHNNSLIGLKANLIVFYFNFLGDFIVK